MERETCVKSDIKRIYVEKKSEYAVEAEGIKKDLTVTLRLNALSSVRILNRYDLANITDEELRAAVNTVFSEPPVDIAYFDDFPVESGDRAFAVEYLPGQYDQRADWAAQCLQILTQREKPIVRTAKVFVLAGVISDCEFKRIKDYCINKVEAREASFETPESLYLESLVPSGVEYVLGFTSMTDCELRELIARMNLAMGFEDLLLCRAYFKDIERRDPTVAEIRVLDTYWSDHCRHTTFLTRIKNIDIKNSKFSEPIREAYLNYLSSRRFVYGESADDLSFMDLATIAAKELKKKGLLKDLDQSDEINAASIVVSANIDGKIEDYLVMFKNETHNHPTEIEPFGGAATCLGGAIRDPLSGRAYAYQAMRVTGSGDPRSDINATLPGKLPQKKITTGAAAGFSAYGNQVGLATGFVKEIYDEGYVAKRMEIGAVIAAAPKAHVQRLKPAASDVVILLGGKTGRDGCGGATGSSKPHTEESLASCGAEVQKGNPVEERKIQRLFRKPYVANMIKKCNDFGAGGVSVAIGELADGLVIDLDAVPKKYEGLDGTEIAISESQERMAVVVAKADAKRFIIEAAEENLEATIVAEVTESLRLKMHWRGKTIVDLGRDFLNSNGAARYANVRIKPPNDSISPFCKLDKDSRGISHDIEKFWIDSLSMLSVCSQSGLVERFDSSIGAGSVLMPFGGEYQLTPVDGMVAKLPVLYADTSVCTIMTSGYDPSIANWSPFHAGIYSVVEAAAKAVALGADYKRIRLTLQEYFERLGSDPEKWGKVLSALLGAYYAQKNLGIAAIGGKDSMSGTFNDLNVPPTIVAFAVAPADVNHVISPEFKESENHVILLPVLTDSNYMPDFKQMEENYHRLHELVIEGKVKAAYALKSAGLIEAVSKMCFGNKIGFNFEHPVDVNEISKPMYGSIVIEISGKFSYDILLEGLNYVYIGRTTERKIINAENFSIDLIDALNAWQSPLESIFPTKTDDISNTPETYSYQGGTIVKKTSGLGQPKVLLPVFPGTNCEYDTAFAFKKAGAKPEILVFKNRTVEEITDSLDLLAKEILSSQIICLPGGFSAGDEPDGSGKFIATVFRNPKIKDALSVFLEKRDGLMLGICNGFQALIKLGLLPYGEVTELDENSPTLTYNAIGRHVSRMIKTRVASTKSPWLQNLNVGDVHVVAVSHGEGRFVASKQDIKKMAEQGQIAFQYVDSNNIPTYNMPWNPNGSIEAIEGILSPDGRILGKMAHSERIGTNVAKNVPGNKVQRIFEAGVAYFA
jgi:phosphoribosylformylglycinamidine synthase